MLPKVCEILSLKSCVRSSQRWLPDNLNGLSVDETCTKEMLWDQRTTDLILTAGRKSLDVSSLP